MPKFMRQIAISSLLLTVVLSFTPSDCSAQQRSSKTATTTRLPAADKIINDYVRAIGGKRRLATVQDTVYEWDIVSGEAQGTGGRGRLETKAPASVHWKFDFAAPQEYAGVVIEFAATPRTSWALEAAERAETARSEQASASPTAMQTPLISSKNLELSTLTGNAANVARLQAAIFAGRLLNYKKQNILARTLGAELLEGEAAYSIEVSTRDGAHLKLLFSQKSKLLLRVDGQVGNEKIAISLDDYLSNDEILEPHRVAFIINGKEPLRLALRTLTRNTKLADAVFDPPGEKAIDVPALLREVASNQQILDERISEYTFTRKQTEREINDRGEVKKEKTVVHEIYPVRGGGRVLKLVSENDIPLAGERLAREERRVGEEIGKIERENARRTEEKTKRIAKRKEEAARRGNESGAGGDGDDDLGVAAFLRACEFVAPRRERFRDRDAVVFDFRPRPGFKPSNRGELLVSKLAGIVWIDPTDKQVMRLEAKLTDGFKIGGGLLASVRSGSAFVIEQTRLADGVWLPRFSQINASAKVFLLAGFRLDATREYGDYKRFSTDAKNYELNVPKEQ